MDGRDLSFRLDLVGQKVILTPNKDFIDDSCRSQVGQLESVLANDEGKTPTIEAVRFVFNPGACSVQVVGRETIWWEASTNNKSFLSLYSRALLMLSWFEQLVLI